MCALGACTLARENHAAVCALRLSGVRDVTAVRRPRVALLSSGNELADLAGDADGVADGRSGARIFDSNRPMLDAAVRSPISASGGARDPK